MKELTEICGRKYACQNLLLFIVLLSKIVQIVADALSQGRE
jgi:hypothetical protein